MSDKKAPIEFVHTSLGWGENNGTPIFKSYKLLISKEVCSKVITPALLTLNRMEVKKNGLRW